MCERCRRCSDCGDPDWPHVDTVRVLLTWPGYGQEVTMVLAPGSLPGDEVPDFDCLVWDAWLDAVGLADRQPGDTWLVSVVVMAWEAHDEESAASMTVLCQWPVTS